MNDEAFAVTCDVCHHYHIDLPKLSINLVPIHTM